MQCIINHTLLCHPSSKGRYKKKKSLACSSHTHGHQTSQNTLLCAINVHTDSVLAKKNNITVEVNFTNKWG